MGKKPNILRKQVLLYSVIFLLFIIGMIGLAYNDMQNISDRINYMVQNGYNGTLLLFTDQFLDPMYQTATQVCNDTEVLSIMRQYHADLNEKVNFLSEETRRKKMADILSSHNTAGSNDWRIAVYDTAGNYICDDPCLDMVHWGCDNSKPKEFSSHLQSMEDRGYTFLNPCRDPYADQEAFYFSLIFPIAGCDGNCTYGYVEIQQTVERLYAYLSPHIPKNLDMYLFYHWDTDRTSPILYSRNPYPNGEVENYHKTENHSEYGWDIILLRDQKTLLEDFQPLLTYLAIGIMSLYALLMICIYVVARYTNKPILKLNEKVKQITLEHMPDGPVAEDATDEIKELEHSFDLMVHRLNKSFQLEKKAYLNALQAQMNPHFLYNSLSNISAMCTTGRTESIPDFCYFLADILRYSSNFDASPVTLEDEVKNVSNYLELMKLRYPHKFDYSIHTDPELMGLPMPRLILQPIVENCFEHGFQTMAPPWRVSVDIHREEDLWCIIISDNGCGFDEKKRQQLFAQVDDYMENLDQTVSELQIGGLGLVNTILRLRLAVDDQLVYDIASAKTGGTIITLKGAMPI